jgi:hypothetical protein
MAIPIIDSTTSIQGHRQGEAWYYQPATTNTPATTSWTWTGLPPGVTADAASGPIFGPATAPGVFLARLTATNASGTSDPVIIPIAIFGRTWGEDGAIPINIDVRTGLVWPHGFSAWKEGDPVAFGKSGDWLLLDVGFTSDGGNSLIMLGPVQLTFGVKQYEPEGLIAISGGEFSTIGEWDATRYRILCHLDRSNTALMAALSDNEADADTQFDARCELTWTQQIADGSGGTQVITRSTRSFTLRLAREFIQ